MRVERLSQDNGAGTWAVVGDVDIFATAKLHAVLQEELKAEHDVVLYLSQVTFLDSTGLGTLWGGAKRASTRGMRFALRANASVPVMQILDLAGARDRFEWVSAGGDDEAGAGVREPRRPRPYSGSASAARSPNGEGQLDLGSARHAAPSHAEWHWLPAQLSATYDYAVTRGEAQRECERLARDDAERDRFSWFPRKLPTGEWTVARVNAAPRAKATGSTVEAKPTPTPRDDPGNSHLRDIGGPYASP